MSEPASSHGSAHSGLIATPPTLDEDMDEAGLLVVEGGKVEELILTQTLPDERIDSHLRVFYPLISRGNFKRLIEEGHITINGRTIKPTHTPKAGDVVRIEWPKPEAAGAEPEEMDLEILFEDEDLVVLNKAPGIVVHPAVGHYKGTLVNGLLHHCRGQLSGIGGVARPGIVHRLDKDTSGCLVVAKNDQTHIGLAHQFAERKIHKMYRALVCGQPAEASGQIRMNIARHPTNRKRMAVVEGQTGREAWTSYRVVERLREAASVEVMLHTGRTHQVRVHFMHLCHPLIGDDVYGPRANKNFTQKTGIKARRQMLHAYQLGFRHPRSGQAMRWQAPLPEDFLEVLAALQIKEPAA